MRALSRAGVTDIVGPLRGDPPKTEGTPSRPRRRLRLVGRLVEACRPPASPPM